MVAKIEGRTYEIPEMWMVGFCRGGKTPVDALRHWHEQEMMEVTFKAQRDAAR